jgi:cytohesin
VLLIANGANVKAKGLDRWTPLHSAISRDHKEIAELLIAEGADVNAKMKFGGTPLHLAADRGQKEIAELLIAKGADVNAKTKEGKTPLAIAITYNPKTSDLLRKHGGKTGEELKAAVN